MAKIVEQTIKRRGVYWIRKAHIRDEFVRQKICFVEDSRYNIIVAPSYTFGIF